MDKNYQFFLKTNIDNYVGKWIAICEQKIVASGKDAKKVFEEAKQRCPRKRQLLTRVPDKETMIF